MPAPKRRRLLLTKKRVKRKETKKTKARVARINRFIFKSTEALVIYRSLFKDLIELSKRQKTPSMEEVTKINLTIKKLKKISNSVVFETLKLETTLGKERMDSTRYELRNKMSNLIFLCSALEGKFGNIGIESPVL